MVRKEVVLSYIAGAVFSFAWWLWIDCNVYTVHMDEKNTPIVFKHYLPAIISTVGLIMINAVSWNDLNGNNLFGDGVSTKARVWFFFSFVVAFAGLITAIWMGIAYWFQKDPTTSVYPGVAIIISNSLIFSSAMIYRFAKPSDENAGL